MNPSTGPLLQTDVDTLVQDAEDFDLADFQDADPGEVYADDTSLSINYPPESTWVAWECVVEPIVDYRQIRHKPLSGTVTSAVPEIDPFGAVADFAGVTDDPTAMWSQTVPDIIQQTASPSMILRLTGFAVRIAYRAIPPYLVSYAGQTPVLLHSRCPERTMAVTNDVLMYRVDWELIYLIPAAPSALPLVADPMLGIDGSDA